LGILFAIVSVITKIILIVLVPIVLILYIGALSSGTPDKRYRDGTKGNERTQIIALVAAIAMFFVASFIKIDADD
jgi:heme/copper-type cytochrome/quinol oxidase subunit 2